MIRIIPIWFILLLLLDPLPVQAQAGALDPTFSTDGYTIIAPDGPIRQLKAMAVASGGRVVLGMRFEAADFDDDTGGVIRLLEDGSTDPSFGSDGLLALPELALEDLIIAEDGRILVVGTRDKMVVVMRLLEDGTPDPSFSFDGLVTTAISGWDSGKAIHGRADGRIVVGAVSDIAETPDQISVVQYLHNGKLDLQFGTNGIVSTNYDVDEFKNVDGLAELPDGSLMIAGSIADIGSQDLLLARFTVDGQVDMTFGQEGVITDEMNAGPEGGYVFPEAMVLDPQERPMIAGSVNNDPSEGWLVRYTSDGVRDPSFSFDGLVNTILFAQPTRFNDLVLQPDGKILVAGRSGNDPVVVRYTIDSALDLSFGGNGSVVHSLGDLEFGYSEMALDASGRILLAGVDYDVAEGHRVVIARAYNDIGLGVADPSANERAVPFPNPVDDTCTLTTTLEQGGMLACELHDIQGRLVRTFFTRTYHPAGAATVALDLGGLAAGHYTVVLSNGNARSVAAIVKQ